MKYLPQHYLQFYVLLMNFVKSLELKRFLKNNFSMNFQ